MLDNRLEPLLNLIRINALRICEVPRNLTIRSKIWDLQFLGLHIFADRCYWSSRFRIPKFCGSVFLQVNFLEAFLGTTFWVFHF